MYKVNLSIDMTRKYPPTTKLDALAAKRDALEAALEAVNAQLEGLDQTECGLTCSGCGEVLATEYNFAAHFIVARADLIADRLNLGSCPVTDRGAK